MRYGEPLNLAYGYSVVNSNRCPGIYRYKPERGRKNFLVEDYMALILLKKYNIDISEYNIVYSG